MGTHANMDMGSIEHYCAEIKASDLGQSDSSTIRERVFRGLLEITDEATINTIQVIPERWPQKVIIEMNNQQNKEKIINLGISVNNKHIFFIVSLSFTTTKRHTAGIT